MRKKSAAGKSPAEETIVNKELFEALAALEKERGISQDYMLERVEAALLSAFRKEYVDYSVYYKMDDEIMGQAVEMFDRQLGE